MTISEIISLMASVLLSLLFLLIKLASPSLLLFQIIDLIHFFLVEQMFYKINS